MDGVCVSHLRGIKRWDGILEWLWRMWICLSITHSQMCMQCRYSHITANQRQLDVRIYYIVISYILYSNRIYATIPLIWMILIVQFKLKKQNKTTLSGTAFTTVDIWSYYRLHSIWLPFTFSWHSCSSWIINEHHWMRALGCQRHPNPSSLRPLSSLSLWDRCKTSKRFR